MTRAVARSRMSVRLMWRRHRHPVCQGGGRSVRWSLTALVCATGLVAACDNPKSTVAPSPPVSLTGTWDAQFSGTVQEKGAAQADRFVLELLQSGSHVSGMLRYEGTDVAIPVSGETDGRRFDYATAGLVGPNCRLTATATSTVDATGSRLSGALTQQTCKGTAGGKVTATKR